MNYEELNAHRYEFRCDKSESILRFTEDLNVVARMLVKETLPPSKEPS